MNQNEKALAELVRTARNAESYMAAMGQNHNALTAAIATVTALESQPVASEPIGWGWKNEMGITEVRTDRMSKEMIAKLNAFPVYASPQPVAGQVSGEGLNIHSLLNEFALKARLAKNIDEVRELIDSAEVVFRADQQPRPVSAGKDVIQIGFFERTGYGEDDFELRHFHEGMNDVPERWVAAYADKKYWDDFLKEKPYSSAQQPQAPVVEVPILDCRCMCEACEARTKETYNLTIKCYNCGWDGVALIRKGDGFPSAKDCPNCGNMRLLAIITKGAHS